MIYRIFSIAFLLLLSVCAMAQDESVMHEVKAGETKYGISREYNISIERLEKFNPDIKSGLKVGMTLLIPPPKETEEDKRETMEPDSGFVKHEVKAGETLFSLSQTYGVPQRLITQNNPQIQEGLKVGQVLRIPIPAPDKGDVEKPEGLSGDFCYHKVKPKETAWSLSQYYEISLDSLYLLNPEAEAGLRIGQPLRLPPGRCKQEGNDTTAGQGPKRGNEELATDAPQQQQSAQRADMREIADTVGGYLLYKVKTGDSFYSLKQRFNVEQDELVTLNPEVSKGLEVDKYIIIPQKKEREDLAFFEKLFRKTEMEGPDSPPGDDQIAMRDSLNDPIGREEKPKIINEDTLDVDITKNYRVALMLPFFAVSDTAFDYQQRVEPRSKYALDFYNGFLMAADSLTESGMNLSLNVMDTENSMFKLRKMVPRIRRNNYDLVVGPLYAQNVEYVAKELEDDEVPVISPLSSTVDLKGHPNLIKCIPGTDASVSRIAYLLNNIYDSSRVVLVDYQKKDGSSQRQEINQIKARLQPRFKRDFVKTLTITEDEMSFTAVNRALPDTGHVDSSRSVVVTLSDDKVFLSGLIGTLRGRDSDSNRIFLIGSSKLMNMPTIDLDYLNELNFTMPDVNYVNYGARETVDFVAAYRDRYGAEPSRYAFQGYDVGMYFLRKLWKTGPFFMEAIRDAQPMLTTGFEMEKTPDGGFQNTFLILTGIRNYELVKVDRARKLKESEK